MIRAACGVAAAVAVLATGRAATAADPARFPAPPWRSEDAALGPPHARAPAAPSTTLAPLVEWSPTEPRVLGAVTLRAAHGPPLPPTLKLSEPAMTQAAKGPKRILGLSVPAFIAFGAGSLSAGGALITHMAATAPAYSDPKQGCGGPCSDNPQTLALASKLLGAFAAAALSTGLVLAVTDTGPKKADFKPSLRLNLSPKKAGASALWVF